MNQYFLSEENIINQTKLFIRFLQFDKNELNKQLIMKCKNIMNGMMIQVFDKYATLKPSNIPMNIYLQKMNDKSVANCIELMLYKQNNQQYQQQMQYTQQNKQNTQQNTQQPRFAQDNNQNPNLYKNPNEIMKQLMSKNQNNEYMSPNLGDGNFASFSNEELNGPFITATGDVGAPMQYNGEDTGGKKNFASELERRLNSLQTNYGGGNNQPQIDPQVAKLLGLDRNRNGQPAQSNSQSHPQSQSHSQPQQQEPQQEFDYSDFIEENIGSNFNQAFTGNEKNMSGSESDNYNGVDSFNNNFRPITQINENDPKLSGDVNKRMQMLESERKSQNNVIDTGKKPKTFDPMKSPNMGENQKDFFF